MDTLYVNSYEALAEQIADDYYSVPEIEISVVTESYEETKEILSELAFCGFDLSFVNLSPFEDEEYLIVLDADGLSCETARGSGGSCKIHATDLLYVSNNVSSTFLSSIQHEEAIAYEVCEELDDVHDKLLEDCYLDSAVGQLNKLICECETKVKKYDDVTNAIIKAFASR